MRRFLALALTALVLSLPSISMAATLTNGTITTAGIAVSPTAVAAGGDKCANDGLMFALVVNSHAANTYTITFDAQGTQHGETITDRAVAIAVQSTTLIGPFPTSVFNDSGGYLNFTYTGSAPATDLKVKCFHLPRPS